MKLSGGRMGPVRRQKQNKGGMILDPPVVFFFEGLKTTKLDSPWVLDQAIPHFNLLDWI